MQVQAETKPYDSINVTPMLDLAYVLLVIFILMTTASVQGLSINLPKPSNKPSTEKHEIRIIQISPDGSLHLNGVGVSVRELEVQLKEAREKSQFFEAVIDVLKKDYGVRVVKKPVGKSSRKTSSQG